LLSLWHFFRNQKWLETNYMNCQKREVALVGRGVGVLKRVVVGLFFHNNVGRTVGTPGRVSAAAWTSLFGGGPWALYKVQSSWEKYGKFHHKGSRTVCKKKWWQVFRSETGSLNRGDSTAAWVPMKTLKDFYNLGGRSSRNVKTMRYVNRRNTKEGWRFQIPTQRGIRKLKSGLWLVWSFPWDSRS